MTRTPSTLDLSRIQSAAFVVGIVGLVAAVLWSLIGSTPFFGSYLYAFLFWVGLSLGCLVMLFVQHAGGGSWGAMIRRPLEAGVSVLPIMALLFVPLLFGLGSLYDWTHSEYLAVHPTVEWKANYLNIPFFILRSAVYFAIWSYAAVYFVRQSARQDKEVEVSGKIAYRLRMLSGPWIVVYIITMTLAAVDWAMSLTPDWWSGIYGVIFMIGQAITAVSFIIGVMAFLAARDPKVDEVLTSKRLQDLGNFLMAFTMFWAYVSFSQLIILWSNNTVETSTWYVLRLGPGWSGLAAFLLVFGFFAPFAILFSRWVKRKRRALVTVAIWSVVVQLLNLFWFIIPTFQRRGFPLSPLDLLLLVGMGGIWLAVFTRSLSAHPILPLHDPRLAKVVDHA